MATTAHVRVKVASNVLRQVGRQEAGKQVARVTRQTFNRARVLSPWDTGNMRGQHGISLRTDAARRQVIGTVYVKTNYAVFVHEGTAPHIIRPKASRRRADGKATALKFKIGGRTIYARMVRHPGTRARPWLATALAETAARNNFRLIR